VEGVYAALSAENSEDVRWQPIVFSQDASDPSRWVADVPLPPGDVRLNMSATDVAGNVAFFTAKGLFVAPTQRDEQFFYLPIIKQ
jgi:hypothetical protein